MGFPYIFISTTSVPSCDTGPYVDFPHCGTTNLGQAPCGCFGVMGPFRKATGLHVAAEVLLGYGG